MRFILAVITLALSSTAVGDKLRCNKGQTKCTVLTTYLTIGDEVGVFNKNDELVAHGKVKAMRGERRAILINERHGRINKSHRLALLETSPDEGTFESAYKIYRRPAKMSAGGHIGFATVGIGDGAPGLELSGFAEWRKWRGIKLLGRATFLSTEAEVTRYEGIGFETGILSANGLGIMGGAAYSIYNHKTLSFRGEADLGTMYMMADVDGNSSHVDNGQYETKINNGFGLYVRAAAGALYNMDDWHISIDLAQSMAHKAYATTIAGGLIKDLK